ncbi:transposase domain-containing protein [Streptomyces sp. NPDC056480]|uniref:transposase domain-containing protein n=1 Tax=Streptomyces sp. NPDC056480 TaxID=3345833 RepID=UPI003685E5E8
MVLQAAAKVTAQGVRVPPEHRNVVYLMGWWQSTNRTVRIALGVLTRVFPPGLVDEVVVECGWVEQRSRLLPARVVVCFVLAMCLFAGAGL